MKGATSIGIVTALSAITVLFMGWNGFNSVKVIGTSEQTAVLSQRQTDIESSITEYQSKSDKSSEKLSEDVGQLKLDMATTKEIVKLLGEINHINSDAVEARIIKEVQQTQESSTTALK